MLLAAAQAVNTQVSQFNSVATFQNPVCKPIGVCEYCLKHIGTAILSGVIVIISVGLFLGITTMNLLTLQRINTAK